MPNEFEKQVKQKMEELSFVPQEPVWENIEKQIRKKKDRKRMILWLPVLLLLVGGTAVWLNHQSEAGHRLETNADHKLNEYKAEVHGQSDEPLSDSHHTNTAEGSIAGKDKQAGEQQNSQTTANSSAQIDDKNESKRIELSEVKAIASKKHSFNNIQLNSSSSVSRVSSKQKQSIIAQETENTNYYLPVVNDPILHTYDVQKNTWPDKINTRPLITANLLQNESSNKVADKHVHSWKVGVMVDAGKSSLRNKLDLSSNALRDNYAASPASYSNYVPPSDIKNGLSFAIGFVLKRQLGKRSFLSTGITYNYYSTQMSVGANVTTDTLLSTNRAVRNYYLNSSFVTNSLSYPSTSTVYRNQYHFISLPVAINYQLLRSIPIDIHFGISYQRLIASNALQYDYVKNIYYRDNSVLNKNQLFSELGINYSLLKNRSLIIGPQYQYGITSLDDKNHHLGAFIVKAVYVF